MRDSGFHWMLDVGADPPPRPLLRKEPRSATESPKGESLRIHEVLAKLTNFGSENRHYILIIAILLTNMQQNL
jgi:hypothetical protein